MTVLFWTVAFWLFDREAAPRRGTRGLLLVAGGELVVHLWLSSGVWMHQAGLGR
jgi:hypothetical protein